MRCHVRKRKVKKLSIHIAFLNAHLGEIPLVAIMMDNELLHVHFYISQKSARPYIASAYGEASVATNKNKQTLCLSALQARYSVYIISSQFLHPSLC